MFVAVNFIVAVRSFAAGFSRGDKERSKGLLCCQTHCSLGEGQPRRAVHNPADCFQGDEWRRARAVSHALMRPLLSSPLLSSPLLPPLSSPLLTSPLHPTPQPYKAKKAILKYTLTDIVSVHLKWHFNYEEMAHQHIIEHP